MYECNRHGSAHTANEMTIGHANKLPSINHGRVKIADFNETLSGTEAQEIYWAFKTPRFGRRPVDLSELRGMYRVYAQK